MSLLMCIRIHDTQFGGVYRFRACAVLETPRFQECLLTGILADLCSDLVPKITCQVGSPGLSPASGFEHPASTLSTRFPAALGIGHGQPAA